MSDEIERTLTVLRECHVYTLPPRPHGGFRCQDWPKTSHIFSGRVRVVTRGTACTVKLEDVDTGTLFAQCPLDNENPRLSVEPVSDSSRYFVIRVADGSGRYAYLGMGFLEREPDVGCFASKENGDVLLGETPDFMQHARDFQGISLGMEQRGLVDVADIVAHENRKTMGFRLRLYREANQQ